MRIEYDRSACQAWFQCVQKWDAFEMDLSEGKAELDGAKENENGNYVREVPEEAQNQAIQAAQVCPVDAISIHDDHDQTDSR